MPWRGVGCNFICNLIIERFRIKSLAAHEAYVGNRLQIRLQPYAGKLRKVKSQVNALYEPGWCLRHFAFDTPNQERVLVHPGSSDDQLSFPAFRLESEDMTCFSIYRSFSKICEIVIRIV